MKRLNNLEGGGFWVASFISAILAIVPRIIYFRTPFDRDEGGYAYIADIIQQGGLPYVNVFDHKPPLIYYFYYLSFKLFGHTVVAPRVMAALFVSVACFLLLLLVYRLTKNLPAAVFSCLVLGLASTSTAYAGFSANTEIFTLPFMVGGVILLANEEPSIKEFFYAGLFFGIGFIIKQPIALVAAVVFAYHGVRLLGRTRRVLPSTLVFSLGSALPLIAVMIFFAVKGEYTVFWKSAFSYNFGYISDQKLTESISLLAKYLKYILSRDPVTWLLGLFGIILTAKSRISAFSKGYLIANVIGASLAIAMGMRFYPHYFIFVIPFLAVCAGLGFAELSNFKLQKQLQAAAVLLLCFGISQSAKNLFMPDNDFIKSCYSDNTIIQAKTVGNYLLANATPGSSLFIIGSEPEIYFYSKLKAASRVCYLYPVIMETLNREALRNELLADLDRRLPDYIVVVNRGHSLGLSTVLNDTFMNMLFGKFSGYQVIGMLADDSDSLVIGKRQEMMSISSEEISMLLLKRPQGSKPAGIRFGELLDTDGI